MEEDWLRIGWHCTSCSAYQYWSRADFPMPKVEVEGRIPAALLVTQGKWLSHMAFVNVHELCYETVQVEREGGSVCLRESVSHAGICSLVMFKSIVLVDNVEEAEST